MPFALSAVVAVTAVFMAKRCLRNTIQTWKMPTERDTESKAFFAVYFRWFSANIRYWWALCRVVFATCLLFRPNGHPGF